MERFHYLSLLTFAAAVLVLTYFGSSKREGQPKNQIWLGPLVIIAVVGSLYWATHYITTDGSTSRKNLESFIQMVAALMVALYYCVQFDSNKNSSLIGIVLVIASLFLALIQFPDHKTPASDKFFEYLTVGCGLALGLAGGMLANHLTAKKTSQAEATSAPDSAGTNPPAAPASQAIPQPTPESATLKTEETPKENPAQRKLAGFPGKDSAVRGTEH